MAGQRSIIATYLAATCEKTMVTLEQTLSETYDWAIDRIHHLSEIDLEDAYAIQEEFSEWLDPSVDDHDIFSMRYIRSADK